MKRLIASAAAIFALPIVLFAAPVAATSAGQIEFGNIYRVRNVTDNGAFTDPAAADKCETVQFKVRIHNPGPDTITGVTAKATLPTTATTSVNSVMTVSAANANPTSVSDTASVTLSDSLKISYVAGSTELLDANGVKLSNLPDGITGSGVSVPNGVGVSTQQERFVQFQAKTDCPTPPVTPAYSCTALKVTADSRNKFTFVTSASATNGATISKYNFNFGDGNKADSATNTASHEYAKDGTYNVTVTVFVTVNGKSVEVTSQTCKAVVTVKPVETPPTTPPVTPPATELPNTGAGNVLGLFAGISIAGAVAHNIFRRVRQES